MNFYETQLIKKLTENGKHVEQALELGVQRHHFDQHATTFDMILESYQNDTLLSTDHLPNELTQFEQLDLSVEACWKAMQNEKSQQMALMDIQALQKYWRDVDPISGFETILSKTRRIMENLLNVAPDHNYEPESPEKVIDKLVYEQQQILSGSIPKNHQGLVTNFRVLDQHCKGMRNSNYIILAARPGAGKTTKAVKIVSNAILNPENKNPHVLYFSNEVDTKEIYNKIIASQGNIPLDNLENGPLNKVQQHTYNEITERLKKTKLKVYDKVQKDFDKVIRTIEKKCHRGACQLAVIDYLQQFYGSDPRAPRHLQLGEMSGKLQSLAKRYQIPILVLVQLNRDFAKDAMKNDKVDPLSYIKDCGTIEQDADVVLFLEAPNENERNLYIVKNRFGRVGFCGLKVELEKANLSDMSGYKGVSV